MKFIIPTLIIILLVAVLIVPVIVDEYKKEKRSPDTILKEYSNNYSNKVIPIMKGIDIEKYNTYINLAYNHGYKITKDDNMYVYLTKE
jgi:maltodextrin utilization protein YvdJ